MSEYDAMIQLAKVQESIVYILKGIEELKAEIKQLHADVYKNAEETKDCYYISETNRKRLEEFSEELEDELARIKVTQENLSKLFDEREARQDRKVITWLQAIVTIGSIVFGVMVKLGLI